MKLIKIAIMKRFLFLIIVILLPISRICALTSADRTIDIDGYSDDFDEYYPSGDSLDEGMFTEIEELKNDSWWGENNDLYQIKITWNNENLFVALDARCWDNNVILFFDVDTTDVDSIMRITNMNRLTTGWNRAFYLYGICPDFFLATWDTNTKPQFWQMKENSETEAIDISSSINSYATFSQGELGRSMEASIPWDILFNRFEYNGTIPDSAVIRILGVITSKDDGKSGPDCAPDNLGCMPQDGISSVVLDNYILLYLDKDGNGQPDLNIAPRSQIIFHHSLPLKCFPLETIDVTVTNKVFTPFSKNVEKNKVEFEVITSRANPFYGEVYNLSGKKVRNLGMIEAVEETKYSGEWDGKDDNGKIVDFGIYIIRFYTVTGELRENIPVVLIK